MTVHSLHPDVYEHGLAPECKRCIEHAERPWASLDDRMLRDLRDRVERRVPPRSDTEAIAMARLKDALVIEERLAAL